MAIKSISMRVHILYISFPVPYKAENLLRLSFILSEHITKSIILFKHNIEKRNDINVQIESLDINTSC